MEAVAHTQNHEVSLESVLRPSPYSKEYVFWLFRNYEHQHLVEIFWEFHNSQGFHLFKFIEEKVAEPRNQKRKTGAKFFIELYRYMYFKKVPNGITAIYATLFNHTVKDYFKTNLKL